MLELPSSKALSHHEAQRVKNCWSLDPSWSDDLPRFLPRSYPFLLLEVQTHSYTFRLVHTRSHPFLLLKVQSHSYPFLPIPIRSYPFVVVPTRS